MSAVNAIIDFLPIKAFLLMLLTFGYLFIHISHSQAANEDSRGADIRVVEILTTDELGKDFRYPSHLGYDKDMDELYVVAGGKKTIVFNSTFFPTVSLGPGRGAEGAQGIYINDDGMIYLCQARTEEKNGRLTIFNPAFFPVKVITFESVPDVEDFIPRKVVVGVTGNIYVVGQNNRGVVVLDPEGNFSHWLKPEDIIFNRQAAEVIRDNDDKDEPGPELTDIGTQTQEEIEEETEEEGMAAFLPPELVPKSLTRSTVEKKKDVGPVTIVDINRDTEGHLYILSEETSKVYVYSPFEEFLFSFGEKGGSSGKMSRPKSLAIDEKKKAVYICDYMRHTILIFDLSGRFMYEFGGLGTGPGWFQYPTGLTLNRDGLLAVADLFNGRVQVLDVNFEYKFPLFKTEEMKMPSSEEEEETFPELPESPETEGREGEDILEPQPL